MAGDDFRCDLQLAGPYWLRGLALLAGWLGWLAFCD